MVDMTSWATIFATSALLASACDGRPSEVVHYTVFLPMRDLETNWRGEVAVETTYEPWFAWEEFEAGELASWEGNVRLVRWPSEEFVPGRWVFAVDRSMNRGVFSFEPETPLSPADGWYAVQIRFGGLGVRRGYFGPELFSERDPGGFGHQFHDGWSTTRFHRASYPLLGLWGGSDLGDDRRAPSAGARTWISEPLVARADIDLTGSVHGRVAGESVRCTADPASLRAGEPFPVVTLACDPPTRAGQEFSISLDPLPLQSREGLEVHYCGAGGRPQWSAHMGGLLDDDDCDDAALLDIPPTRAP